MLSVTANTTNTKTKVKTTSIIKAPKKFISLNPFAPNDESDKSFKTLPSQFDNAPHLTIRAKTVDAAKEPTTCEITYPTKVLSFILPSTSKANDTAGLRWQPLNLPTVYAATIIEIPNARAIATTSEVTIAVPQPKNTRINVPIASAAYFFETDSI